MPTLDWIGKKSVVNHHTQIPYRLIKCDSTLSAGDPEAENLLVQGDNLLALKALLPYYAGQVKCIYIDPPYNTGEEKWQYNDNVNSPEIRKWLNEVVGKEGEDLSRHDKWLCMMYPRLQLLKKYLKEDGVIFISIDDNELHNLRTISDEIFGANNFIEIFSWKKTETPANLSYKSKKALEYILCYQKKKDNSRFVGLKKYSPSDNPLIKPQNSNKVLLFRKDNVITNFKENQNFIKGLYGTSKNKVELLDDFEVIQGRISNDIRLKANFVWTQENLNKELSQGTEIRIKTKTLVPSYEKKDYQPEVPWNIIDTSFGVGTTEDGGRELESLFNGKKVFDYPKPTSLIEYLINFVCSENDIILDSFAGTGTTGHAVLKLNQNKGKRKFILIEMLDKIAHDITSQRLKKAIEGYEYNDEVFPNLGSGFKYCNLGEPLFDEYGNIKDNVKFNDLAHHVYFSETGTPLPKNAKKGMPLIGIHNGIAYYLLFNGIMGDKSVTGGNILTSKILEQLPKHNGDKIIYGEGTRLSSERLRKEQIIFRQLPYELKVS